MAHSVSRDVVDAFYRAYVSSDAAQIGAMLDDDVEWRVGGPVAVMQACGYWRGKAVVIERFTHLLSQVVEFKSLDVDRLLVDGDGSAMFGRISCVQRATGRLICHRLAQFLRYRNGKVVSCHVINDTLDAAEQYVGRPINLTGEASLSPADDFISV